MTRVFVRTSHLLHMELFLLFDATLPDSPPLFRLARKDIKSFEEKLAASLEGVKGAVDLSSDVTLGEFFVLCVVHVSSPDQS